MAHTDSSAIKVSSRLLRSAAAALLSAVLLLGSGAGYQAQAKSASKSVTKLVREYRHDSSFEVVQLGGLGYLGLKMLIRSQGKDPEVEQFLKAIKKVSRITVVEYGDAEPETREKFVRRLDKVLSRQDVIMEVKSDGEKVQVYGAVSKDGDTLKDFVVNVPGSSFLMSFTGSIRVSDLGSLVEGASSFKQ